MRRAIGATLALVVVPCALASTTGCYGIAQDMGEAAVTFVVAVSILAVVVGIGLAIAIGYTRSLPVRAVAGFGAGAMFAGALLWLVDARIGIPFDAVGYRIAFVPLVTLLVPIAAARGRARVAGAVVTLALAAVYVGLVVSLHPGSRLPPGHEIDVAIGDDAMCALFDEGGVACVGDASLGQTGTGDVRSARPWALAIDVPPAVSIRGAGRDFCAFTSEDRAYCWGEHFGLAPRLATEAEAVSGEPPPPTDDQGRVCALDGAGEVTCGDEPVPLPAPAAVLRGTNRFVCATLSGRVGVWCWGTTSLVRLRGTPEQTRGQEWVGMIGPRWVWRTPSPIDWP